MTLTRRQTLLSGAALPFAAASAASVRPAAAQDMSMTPPNAIKNSFMLGDFEVSTLLAGTRTVENPQEIFGMNVSPEEFAEVSAANFIPTDKAQFFFTPTVVDTGNGLVLFDTGLNAEGITAALAAAGYAPDDVNTVVITHMHGDHIGGLTAEDGTPTFANAAYVTGQAEFDHWAAQNNEGFEAKVRPLADRFTFIGDEGEVAPGITGLAAFGHTPGHMVYRLSSGDRQVLLMADLANHYVWSVAYPDWEVRFDADKAAAAQSRRRILGMAAAERMPVIGYHMPFPAMGFIDTRGDGFHYVPASYQMMLG
jgi:glyoxylase-like metal-dependent hydrolase (beta-lactamase superfamily II)